MTITKEYIEGLKVVIEKLTKKNNKDSTRDLINYLIGYLQGLINLYETENETKSN